MAKVIVHDGINGKNIFEERYEYVEGGYDEDGTPGFHITAGPATVYVYFKDKEEFKKFLKSLQEQIPLEE